MLGLRGSARLVRNVTLSAGLILIFLSPVVRERGGGGGGGGGEGRRRGEGGEKGGGGGEGGGGGGEGRGGGGVAYTEIAPSVLWFPAIQGIKGN